MSDRGPVLLLDIGNTRIKWSVTECRVRSPWSQVYACRHEDIALCLRFIACFPEPWQAAVIANVSPRQTVSMITDVLKAGGCSLIYEPRVGTQLPICTLSAHAWARILGEDRFAAAVAAAVLFHQHCIVVNCGTCMTVDVIRWCGTSACLIGGHIVPGMDILFHSLSSRLPHLGIYREFFPAECWGRDTMSCIALGMWDAAVGAVLCQYRRLSDGLPGESIRFVISGGNASAIAQGLRYFLPQADIVLCPALVLDGLLYLYNAYQCGHYTEGRMR